MPHQTAALRSKRNRTAHWFTNVLGTNNSKNANPKMSAWTSDKWLHGCEHQHDWKYQHWAAMNPTTAHRHWHTAASSMTHHRPSWPSLLTNDQWLTALTVETTRPNPKFCRSLKHTDFFFVKDRRTGQKTEVRDRQDADKIERNRQRNPQHRLLMQRLQQRRQSPLVCSTTAMMRSAPGPAKPRPRLSSTYRREQGGPSEEAW